jgi:hypothetical protein
VRSVSEGRVEAIFVSPEHGELPRAAESVKAVAGKGLEGNRYFDEGRPGAGSAAGEAGDARGWKTGTPTAPLGPS